MVVNLQQGETAAKSETTAGDGISISLKRIDFSMTFSILVCEDTTREDKTQSSTKTNLSGFEPKPIQSINSAL